MIPTPKLIAAGLVVAALAIGPALSDGYFIPWLLIAGLLLVAVVFDALTLRKVRIEGNRFIPQVLSHQQWTDISLSISNHSDIPLNIKVHDMHPQQSVIRGLPQKQAINASSVVSLQYELMAKERGDMSFTGIDCRFESRLGLLSSKRTLNCDNLVKVYPNFKNNRLFGMLLSRQHLHHLGVRRLPRPGEGSDFHQLREYRDGDSLRQIDWKATARSQKLIAREYALERDQQIVFLLDCSMRMRHQEGLSSHMDDTLNAIVLLTHIALQQGDATGIMTFGGVDRWIPPAKGLVAARRLMNGIYDLQATRELPDYVQAVENLARQLKRRALIILITNLRNEDGQSALQAIQRLRGKHLLLLADLRERDLEQATESTPQNIDEATLWLSAEHYRMNRSQQHKLAIASGTNLLDVSPGQLSADLITRYLAIKRLGKL